MTTRTIVVIPARGGSVRIPGKNLAPVLGKPLLAHSIEQALAATLIDEVYVSTNDEAIARVARDYGAGVVERPAELASNTATSEAALLHALDVVDQVERPVTEVMMLQCTSPVRGKGDIDAAMAQFRREQADSLLSVVHSHRFLWRLEQGGARAINYDPARRPRSQDMAPQFMENGSLYITRSELLRKANNRLGGKIALFEMDFWCGFEIDDPEDLQLIEWILRQRMDH